MSFVRVCHICKADNGHGGVDNKTAKPSGKAGLGTRLLQAAVSEIGAEMTSGATSEGYEVRLTVPRMKAVQD